MLLDNLEEELVWLSPGLICLEQLELVHFLQAVPLSGVFSTSSSHSLGWLVFLSISSTIIWLTGTEKPFVSAIRLLFGRDRRDQQYLS